MPASNTTILTLPNDLEISIERTFNAPRDLVFACFTQAEHLRHWWAPSFTMLVSCEVDFRVGGAYEYVLTGPMGEASFYGEHLEIDPPHRVVSTWIYSGYPDAGAVVTITFTEHEGRTTIHEIIRHKSKEYRDGQFQAGMEQGMNDAFAQLDAHIATLA